VVGDWHAPKILAFLLRLIPDCPVDSLSGLSQTGRAFDEQAPNVLSVLPLERPEEEPLDDLAQSVLRLFRREQDGRGWLESVQCGP